MTEWTLHEGATVVNGGDGFAAFVDSASTSLSISIYGAAGEVIQPVGSLTWSLGGVSIAIEQVSSALGLTALTAGCYYKFRCGEALLVSGLPVVSLDDRQDAYGTYRNAVAVRPDRRLVLSQSKPPSQGSTERSLRTSLLDASGVELGRAEVSTGGLDLVKQLVVLDDHLLLILSNPTPYDERAMLSVLWLLDANFDKITEWRAPAGVALRGMDITPGSSVVLVGSIRQSNTAQEVTWMHTLALPTLAEAASTPAIGTEGYFDDVDAAFDWFVVAGAGPDYRTAWIDILDANGASALSTRPTAPLDFVAYRSAVQVQSNGSILLSNSDHAYVCE